VHKIYLCAPLVQERSVSFKWRIDPPTALYRQTHFTMDFPETIDISRVPERLWWDILLICLHAHWLLLRPCQIHLPIALPMNEKLFWFALLRNGLETLDANGPNQARNDALNIEIIDGDVEIRRSAVSGSGYGTAFSSGKDSLLQAAMLLELSERPLLVATTSPLPSLSDHQSNRRKYVFLQIQKRRDPLFAEVKTDYRSMYNNGYPAHLGYSPSVNELTDTFIYTSSLLAVGAALRRDRLFLASEAEVQESTVLDGRIVQHSHFMYSAATQRSLAALVSKYGIQFGSLIWPLYSMHVQHLLWARYPDLSDLQYSCWRVGEDQATCSECEQCLRIAMTALAGGHNPERMGIDLRKVLAYAPHWKPWGDGTSKEPSMPQDIAARRSDYRVLEAIRRSSTARLARFLAVGQPTGVLHAENSQVVASFRRLRNWAHHYPSPPPLGAREGFFQWLDPDLRQRLIAIYTQHFPKEPLHQHIGTLMRSIAIAERAIAALGV
jgi:hypothetical protein